MIDPHQAMRNRCDNQDGTASSFDGFTEQVGWM